MGGWVIWRVMGLGMGRVNLRGALGRFRELIEGANGRGLLRRHLVQGRLVDRVRAATALGGVGDLIRLTVGLKMRQEEHL